MHESQTEREREGKPRGNQKRKEEKKEKKGGGTWLPTGKTAKGRGSLLVLV